MTGSVDSNRLDDDWSERTDLGKRMFLGNFFPGSDYFLNWQILKFIPDQVFPNGQLSSSVWKDPDDNPDTLIRLDTVAGTAWRQSHANLRMMIEDCRVPPKPSSDVTSEPFGDIGFVSGNGEIDTALFSRANLSVRISSVGTNPAPVLKAAQHIDKLLIGKPPIHKKETDFSKVRVFLPEFEIIGVGEIVKIRIEPRNPLDKPLWWKVMADTGEVFYKDGHVSFISQKNIILNLHYYAYYEGGYVASASAELEVRNYPMIRKHR